jgi:DNA-directed RNA polymerase omega subunit
MNLFNPTEARERGRYTSEDAVNVLGNRYDLVLVASARARELKRESTGFAKHLITQALSEVEEGKIGMEYLSKFVKGNRLSRHHRKG